MQSAPAVCPNCETPIQPAWRVCPRCGQALASAVPVTGPTGPVVRLACPACGGMLPLPAAGQGYMRCGYCGTSLQLQQNAGGVSLALVNQIGEAIGRRIGQEVSQAASMWAAEPADPATQARARQEAELDRLEAHATMLQLRIGQLRRAGNPAALHDAQTALGQTQAQIAVLQQALHLPISAPRAPNWLAVHALWLMLGIALLAGLATGTLILMWATPWLGAGTLWVALGASAVIALGLAGCLLLTNSS